MKLNQNILLIIKYLIVFHCIIFVQSNNNENAANKNHEEESDDYIKIKSEYYKIFYSDIKPIVLTDENYTEYIKTNPFTLIYLHSSIDIHSKNFIPSFKLIHNYLNTKNSSEAILPIRLAAIDLLDDEHTNELQGTFRINAFPFFVIYSSLYGSYIQYTGYMTAQSVLTFCTKATTDNIITLNQDHRLKNILNPELNYMVFISTSSDFNFDEYYRASQEFKFAIFGDCIGQKKCLNYLKNITNIDIDNTDIILIKTNLCKNDFKCNNNEIKKPLYIPYIYKKFENFKEYISLNIMPPIHNLTDFNYEVTTKNKFKTIIYIKGNNEKKSNEEISNILEKIIKEKKYGITWGSILDPINSANDYESTKLFSIEYEDYEKNGLVIIHSPDKILSNQYNIYRIKNLNGELNEENIILFVNEFNSGFIKKDIKSELTPGSHPKKNLRMVVGKTFDKEILKNNNRTNVLILLTLDMKNLHKIEDQIESITIKFSLYNESIIFNFLDPALNEMPDMPNYNILEKPFYRYYPKYKGNNYIDFKGNSMDQSVIEDWIIENYGREYGLKAEYDLKMHVDKMTEILKDEKVFREYEQKQKFEYMSEQMGIPSNIMKENVKENDADKITDL